MVQQPPNSETSSHIDENGEPTSHTAWASMIAGLFVLASPFVWILSAWCGPSEPKRNAVVVVIWLVTALAAYLGAARLLDRFVGASRPFFATFARVLVAAAVVVVATQPILSFMVTADSSC